MTRLAQLDPEAMPAEMRSSYARMSPRDRMLFTPTGHAPELMHALHHFAEVLNERGTLTGRLVELVRLRIAFHNQCRSCMAMRYQSGLDDGLTEDLVCSLEKPQEAPDLTAAEKAALAYADVSATNHFAITDETFKNLRKHFSEPQIVELGLHVGYFIGFGRLVAAWDMSEELTDLDASAADRVTPWESEPFVVGR